MSYTKRWQTILLGILAVFGILYTLPNFYPENPAVVIRAPAGEVLVSSEIEALIKETKIPFRSIFYTNQKNERVKVSNQNETTIKEASIIMQSLDEQVEMKDMLTLLLKQKDKDYIIAMNLISDLPKWMKRINAVPMKLGLDLQGGIHFLLKVDVDSLAETTRTQMLQSIKQTLYTNKIHNTGISTNEQSQILFSFRDQNDLDSGFQFLSKQYPDFKLKKEALKIIATLPIEGHEKQVGLLVNQTKQVIEKRVNELGVSEAIVQQEGRNHISVDIPGIQDIAKAKDLIGKGATLKFFLVDETINSIEGSHPNRSLLYDQNGLNPIWIINDVVLSGNQITNASAGIDERTMTNKIDITPTGDTSKLRYATRAENRGRRLAIVYYENKSIFDPVTGEITRDDSVKPYFITAPYIDGQLGRGTFYINKIRSAEEAQDLALLIRSGSLPTPVAFAEELMIGPSMGAQNIKVGLYSLLIGMGLIVSFMTIYYRLFGVIANLGLIFNVLLTCSALSLIGATLTLPGIAGIVLGVGMAVDANVLINERIREELRLGVSPKAAIQIGYEKAFATIVDANVTTLIVALVLFSLGSGVVKGFAITLSIGLIASMITAVTFTKVIVNRIYRHQTKNQISIGI